MSKQTPVGPSRQALGGPVGASRGQRGTIEHGGIIIDAIRTMRMHLDMEIGYLSEFVGDDMVFRAVDAPGFDHIARPGVSLSRSGTYCNHILSGTLPEMIADTHDHPAAVSLPITHDLPIRSHISIPIERRDGSVYGMFCCLSQKPNATLNDRDLQMMRSFARLAQADVQRSLDMESRKRTASDAIKNIVEYQSFNLVYQPIFDLATGTLSGVEALCRFQSEPYRSPDLWFRDAADVDLAEMLEICVMAPALDFLQTMPTPTYMSLNASPGTVSTGLLAEIFANHRPAAIVLEVTEHSVAADWELLSRELQLLRDMGVRIAIDDAGAGYAGLQQLLRLRPDIIKLDRSLVSFIDQDPAKRALCAAMVYYATETGAAVVAEGIETKQETDVLRGLGVHRGQGYFLGRPMPADPFMRQFSLTPKDDVKAEGHDALRGGFRGGFRGGASGS